MNLLFPFGQMGHMTNPAFCFDHHTLLTFLKSGSLFGRLPRRLQTHPTSPGLAPGPTKQFFPSPPRCVQAKASLDLDKVTQQAFQHPFEGGSTEAVVLKPQVYENQPSSGFPSPAICSSEWPLGLSHEEMEPQRGGGGQAMLPLARLHKRGFPQREAFLGEPLCGISLKQ